MKSNWKNEIDKKMNNISNGSDLSDINILAIDTSCDDTSVAVVRNGEIVLSNIISSQIDIHSRFGGVVPEVASRKHVEVINILIEEALNKAKLTIKDISAIAVTYGPGLIGSLLVGLSAAKVISYINNIPLIGVHHIAGHIYANNIVKPLKFPLIALVVSGGHTELIYMKDHLQFEVLGQTRDDAAGEAYDKVARVLKLPYPGGPEIDKLATKGKINITLPRALLDSKYDFSFSGLKSAVINVVHNKEQKNEELKKEDMATSFQDAVVDVLSKKTVQAVLDKQVQNLIIAGGVAANKGLRSRLEKEARKLGIDLIIPPLQLCTDNAAMIASVGYFLYLRGDWSDLDLNGAANLPLE